MSSVARGKSTLDVEVTNVSKHGFWVLVGGREIFVAFDDFPWFRTAPVGHILNVQRPSAHHLHWPDLDIDLAIQSLESPAAFPLVSKTPRDKAEEPSSRTPKVRPKRVRSGASRS